MSSKVNQEQLARLNESEALRDSDYGPYGTTTVQESPGDALERISVPSSFHEPPETDPGMFGTGSLASCSVNLAQSALGAGTLCMPYAIKSAGSLLGVCFLVIVACSAIYACRLIAKLIEKTGCPTYEQIAGKVIHRYMAKVVALTVCLFCWGITVVYVISIGDILGPLLSAKEFPDVFHGEKGRRITTVIFWVVFMLPLSLLKEINMLRYPSLVALVTLLFFVGTIVAQTGKQTHKPPLVNFDLDMMAALPTMFFSYCCQANVPEIYHEMWQRNPKRMLRSAASAMTFSTFIYICAGIGGVVAFGPGTHSNILHSFTDPDSDWVQITAFIGFSITITFSFPVCLFPPRDAILQVFGYDAYHCPTLVRMLVAGLLATASLIMGLFVTKIVVLFAVLGGICGSLLAFIYPALFSIRSEGWNVATVGWVDFIASWVLLIGGIIAGILGTAMGLYSQLA